MLISQAIAAETAHQTESFFASPELWVAVSFVIVVVWLAKPAVRFVKKATSERADSIRKRIDEAHALKEEAVKMLEDYKERFRNIDKESAAIVEKAKISAEKYKSESIEDMNAALARKEESFALRIEAMERDVSTEIKNSAVEMSVNAVRNLIGTKMSSEAKDALFEGSLGELPEVLKKAAS